MKERAKKILALTMAAVTMVSLAACGGNDKAGTADKPSESEDMSGKTLTVGIWGGNDQESAALDKMMDAFEKQTGAKVESKVYTDYNTQIQADFIAKTAPDVFYIDGNVFPFYSSLGVMEPLDKEEMGLDSYYENLVGTFTAEDGTVYCVPKDVSTLATYYNKDLLDSVGVKPEDIPDALEDYKDFLTDLQKKLDDKYGPGADNSHDL